jgi:AcrR family transcriptional regulator
MQQRSIQTREILLTAAIKQFSQLGFERTTVEQICQEAGVSKGAFFHHFPTKQAAFMAILETWLLGLDTQMTGMVAVARDVPQGLVEMASLTRDIFTAANGQLAMFLEFWTQSCHDPEVWKTTVAPYRRFTELFAGFLRKGMQEGSIRQMDAEAGARMIVALAVGLLLQGLMDPQAASWDSVAVQSMQYMMDGLKRRSE